MKTLSVLLCSLVIAGCASTTINAFKDPLFAEKRYHRVLIFVNSTNLGFRRPIEEAVAARFKRNDVDAIPSLKLMLPTRTWTKTDISKVAIENNIDGVLILEGGVLDYEERRISQPAQTHGQVSPYGTWSATTYGGGYTTVYAPGLEFREIRLLDVRSGKVAWVASSFTGGNAFDDFNTVVNSLADTLVGKLVEDGLVKSP
jgi:hypothetical protein